MRPTPSTKQRIPALSTNLSSKLSYNTFRWALPILATKSIILTYLQYIFSIQVHAAPCTFELGAFSDLHPGHSLTIVGLEIRKSGAASLLVLDPMFKTSPGISRLIGSRFRSLAPDKLLKAYRRGHSYLSKYHSFEILKYASLYVQLTETGLMHHPRLTPTPSALMPLTPSPSPLPGRLMGEGEGIA